MEPNWIDVVKIAGVPTAFVGAILWAIVRAGRWLGEHVLQPLVAKHLEVMDSMTRTSESVADAQKSIGETLKKLAERNES